jgi:isocitrate/isopropylmalate dehydrogenase
MAMILSAALLLDHLGATDAAGWVEGAVDDVIAEGKTLTYDLERSPHDLAPATTEAVGHAVADAVRARRDAG